MPHIDHFPHPAPTAESKTAEFAEILARQRAACAVNPVPSLAERIADLRALERLLKENREALVRAISSDYGQRSEFETLFGEYWVALQSITSAIRQLRRWMRPQRRTIDHLLYPGASNRVIPQPLGVGGVIVPWNFPLNLSFIPLAAILAAGNRAMVKMSENSAAFAQLLTEISPRYLPEEKLKFFSDGGGRGPAFSALPFDHLLFTGSGATGRAVMASAARHLTPVTLELGGKSPAIVAPDFPIGIAAERIIWAKLFNAGQICTTVDHVYLAAGTETEFIRHCQRLVAARVPDINGPDYTSIIDDRAYARLHDTLRDAQQKGATLINLAAGQLPDSARRKFPPHLVLGATDDMIVMQREIFGPILPVLTYRDRHAVADEINSRDRPLAIYPFTQDRELLRFYLAHVMSGGVSVNDALLHVVQHDLPFGGVGASGMGQYHGREGFNTFSKLRPVFYQGWFSMIQKLFQPPYAGRPMQVLKFLIRHRS